MIRSLYKKTSQDKNVHPRAEKAIERFFGAANDRFVFVERCVQDEGDGSQRSEGGDQLVIKRVGFAMHRL